MKKLLIIILSLSFSSCFDKGSSEEKEWGYRKNLPENAEDIMEYKWSDGFLPDYIYYLKAKVSREDFENYIKFYEMTLHHSERVYSDSAWAIQTLGLSLLGDYEVDEWWDVNPTIENEEVFVWQKGDEWNVAKYENGYLYLRALNH